MDLLMVVLVRRRRRRRRRPTLVDGVGGPAPTADRRAKARPRTEAPIAYRVSVSYRVSYPCRRRIVARFRIRRAFEHGNDKGGKTRKMARREVIVRLLNDPNESVVIDLDDVPKDAEDCAAVLQAELAPLSAWIETAEAYARAGHARGFETLMEMVCAPGTFGLDDVRFATRDARVCVCMCVCVCVCVRWLRRRSVTTAVGFGD